MRFSDYFPSSALTPGQQPKISFEVFPPRNDDGMAALRKSLPDLLALKPNFMTVTYGAGGSTRGRTLEIASTIQKEFKLPAATHLTCVGNSRAELDEILTHIKEAGIQNIVALRGDPPKGETSFKPAPDGCRYASELLEHIRGWEKRNNAPRFSIAVGGYPEKHMEATDFNTDLKHLKHKVECGADIIVTQLFYDNADYYRFEAEARKIGITIPIIPGLLPILSGKQIRRIASMCAAKIPAALHAKLDAVGDDDAKAEAVGVEWCREQLKDLTRHGVPGIHFYVLNRTGHISRILQ